MTPLTPTPPPGSPEAVAAGCLCPVLDNAHGRGIEFVDYDSMWRVTGTSRAWWRNSKCPLHGHGAPDADAQGDER